MIISKFLHTLCPECTLRLVIRAIGYLQTNLCVEQVRATKQGSPNYYGYNTSANDNSVGLLTILETNEYCSYFSLDI